MTAKVTKTGSLYARKKVRKMWHCLTNLTGFLIRKAQA